MIKLSALISKPVISIYDCELIGIVYNALFDKKTKTLNYLIILDEENDLEYALHTKYILSASNDAIIVKNNNSVELKQNIDLELESLENITLKPIFSVNGNDYGVIKDIELNDKLSSLKNLYSMGKYIYIFRGNTQQTNYHSSLWQVL